jgi:hypothetical protein
MLRRHLFLALGFGPGLFAADAEWAKVKSTPRHTELRIVKIGSRTAILAQMYEATDESLICTTKSEELSIPKEQIQKIEYHPAAGGSRGRSSGAIKMPNGKLDYLPLWSRPKPD